MSSSTPDSDSAEPILEPDHFAEAAAEAESDAILEPDDFAESATRAERPDWLMGAAEGAAPKVEEATELPGPGTAAPRLRDKDERPRLKLVDKADELGADEAEETAEDFGPPRPEAWKGAASSVPRLRQKPAAKASGPESDSFAGFAQDGIAAKPASKESQGAKNGYAEPAPVPEEPAPLAPLGGETAMWVVWLDHLRFLRHPAVLILAGVVAAGLFIASLLAPKVQEGESVGRIRQQPEAFEGRSVTVGGIAGESYALGPNTAFNLYQGRDTIVVYSQLLRPRLNEKVRVTGTISVGYLDGVPRVTLLDDAKR